jgi:hypothetical protein
MLLVESIQVREVRGDHTQINTLMQEVRAFDPSAPVGQIIKTELVRGRRFVNAEGREFCIGMTKEVEEVLGLPFDIYEDMSSQIYQIGAVLRREEIKTQRLENRLKVIKDMSFWERFSRAFIGFNTLSLK